MNFSAAVSTCLHKSFILEGRASRSEFWYFFIFCHIAPLIFSIPLFLLREIMPELVLLLSFLILIFIAIMLFALCSVQVRRLHDVNRSGWWILLAGVPAGPLILFIWNCSEGSLGDNDFGPMPELVMLRERDRI